MGIDEVEAGACGATSCRPNSSAIRTVSLANVDAEKTHGVRFTAPQVSDKVVSPVANTCEKSGRGLSALPSPGAIVDKNWRT